jgi:hypothetical protein
MKFLSPIKYKSTPQEICSNILFMRHKILRRQLLTSAPPLGPNARQNHVTFGRAASIHSSYIRIAAAAFVTSEKQTHFPVAKLSARGADMGHRRRQR